MRDLSADLTLYVKVSIDKQQANEPSALFYVGWFVDS